MAGRALAGQDDRLTGISLAGVVAGHFVPPELVAEVVFVGWLEAAARRRGRRAAGTEKRHRAEPETWDRIVGNPKNPSGEDVDDYAFVVGCVAEHPAFRRNQRVGLRVGDGQDRVRRTDDVVFASLGVDVGLADAEAAIGTVN